MLMAQNNCFKMVQNSDAMMNPGLTFYANCVGS